MHIKRNEIFSSQRANQNDSNLHNLYRGKLSKVLKNGSDTGS
jgi:hypothetical protein